MSRYDITGLRAGHLTVLQRDELDRRNWLARCDCGSVVARRTNKLRTGHVQTCGGPECPYFRAGYRMRGLTHGMTGSREYESWTAMIQRCTNPARKSYPRYGGRGIRICDRWRESFEFFLADMGKRPPGTSLDRVNVDGDYEPNNCRWADDATQARNRTSKRLWPHQVEQIRWLAECGMQKVAIGSLYGVSDTMVHEIAAKRTWR